MKQKSKKATETTATEMATETTTNSEKSNLLSLNDIYAFFVAAVDGKPIKLNYSNAKTQQYCGTSDFSVNMKIKAYYVFMSADNAEIVKKLDDSVVITDNKADNTKSQCRCKLIKFTDSEALKNAINAVISTKVV